MQFPDWFRRPVFWGLGLTFVVLLLSAYGAERPVVTLSADRSEYRPGETVELTITTQAGGPYDIYVRVSGPKGDLWADEGLQFQKRMIPAATNFVLGDGRVKTPVSIARKELVLPGAYTFEAIVVRPGANPLAESSLPAERLTIYVPALPGINFIAMHDPQSSRYRNDCATCHLDKIRNTSLAPNIKSFHARKVELFWGDELPDLKYACQVCHKGADLLEFSQAGLRKQSPADTCALCHSSFGPGKKLYAR